MTLPVATPPVAAAHEPPASQLIDATLIVALFAVFWHVPLFRMLPSSWPAHAAWGQRWVEALQVAEPQAHAVQVRVSSILFEYWCFVGKPAGQA